MVKMTSAQLKELLELAIAYGNEAAAKKTEAGRKKAMDAALEVLRGKATVIVGRTIEF